MKSNYFFYLVPYINSVLSCVWSVSSFARTASISLIFFVQSLAFKYVLQMKNAVVLRRIVDTKYVCTGETNSRICPILVAIIKAVPVRPERYPSANSNDLLYG